MQATRAIFRPALDERQADGNGFGAARLNLATELAGLPAQAQRFMILSHYLLRLSGGEFLVTIKIKRSRRVPR